MIKRSFTLLLAVWLLTATTFPAYATKANEIEITCQFENAEAIRDADYRSTECVIRHNEQYLIGQFNEDDAAYNVIGYTSDADEATLFQFGKSNSQPDRLVIVGLPDGEYKFETIRTKDDYMVRPFRVSFPSGNASGFEPIEFECKDIRNGKRITFTYEYPKGFDLPMSEPTSDSNLLTLCGIGLVVISLLLILFVANNKTPEGMEDNYD